MTCAVCELPIKPPRRRYCADHDPRRSWYGRMMTKGGGFGTKRYVEHARKQLLQKNETVVAVAARLLDDEANIVVMQRTIIRSRLNDTQPFKLYLIDGWNAPQELPTGANPLTVLRDQVWAEIAEQEALAERRLASLQNMVPDVNLIEEKKT